MSYYLIDFINSEGVEARARTEAHEVTIENGHLVLCAYGMTGKPHLKSAYAPGKWVAFWEDPDQSSIEVPRSKSNEELSS